MTALARRIAIAAQALFVVPGPAFAAGDALAPGDFAWGRAVETHGAGPLQTLLLDAAIYRGAVASDLADLRVFNGAGEVVPHAIRALVDPHEDTGELVPVPLFRLPVSGAPVVETGDASTPGRRIVRSSDVEIEVSADGAIARVGTRELTPGASLAAGSRAEPDAYLVDLSQLRPLERAVAGLDLELADVPAEFVVPVRVEGSDDLVHFEALRTQSALARLDQGGHRIERNEVEFPAVQHRYLRLSAAGGSLPVQVRSAHARLAPELQMPPRQHERITGERAPSGEPGDREVFVYDLGGAIPVDRVQVDFPVANTVVEAELRSSAGPDGPWLHHGSGVLYELDASAGGLRNAEIALPPIRQRYLELVVAAKGGGVGGGIPVLEVAWFPEQLMFVARGEGPFMVGYGRAQVAAARFSAPALLRTVGDPDVDVPRETASLGPVLNVADPSVLEAHAQAPSPRTMALWGVLVVCVGVVLGMSARLLRKMNRPEGTP